MTNFYHWLKNRNSNYFLEQNGQKPGTPPQPPETPETMIYGNSLTTTVANKIHTNVINGIKKAYKDTVVLVNPKLEDARKHVNYLSGFQGYQVEPGENINKLKKELAKIGRDAFLDKYIKIIEKDSIKDLVDKQNPEAMPKDDPNEMIPAVKGKFAVPRRVLQKKFGLPTEPEWEQKPFLSDLDDEPDKWQKLPQHSSSKGDAEALVRLITLENRMNNLNNEYGLLLNSLDYILRFSKQELAFLALQPYELLDISSNNTGTFNPFDPKFGKDRTYPHGGERLNNEVKKLKISENDEKKYDSLLKICKEAYNGDNEENIKIFREQLLEAMRWSLDSTENRREQFLPYLFKNPSEIQPVQDFIKKFAILVAQRKIQMERKLY
jgi:hypothetical protein